MTWLTDPMASDMTTRSSGRTVGAGEMFQLLRDGLPRTRATLCEITGQTRSTVATRIDALRATGLITAAGEAPSTGGRAPTVFAFDPSVRLVLGVDLGATHARIAITDLATTTLAVRSESLDIADGPDIVLPQVIEAALALLAETGRQPTSLVAAGVGLPGPVDQASGRPNHPPIMPGWNDVDVPGLLSASLGVPVLVDNDVNVMALGEHRAAWPEVANLFLVKVGTGIGSGIIADGRLLRGADGAAGDIGHVPLPGAETIRCRCGNFGCLEAVASARAVAESLGGPGANLTGHDVVERVRSGDVDAIHALRRAGRDIGQVLTTCVSLLNPSVIVVGGILSESGEHLLAGIREMVYHRSLPLATEHLQIVTAQTGVDAGACGAAALAIEHVLSPQAIDALVREG